MTRLPLEILYSVLKQLPLVQKLECMFVCRQWALMIGSSFLFTTVHIEEREILDKFIRLIKEKPDLGGQVETLKLDIDRTLYFDLAKFLVLFPNLTAIDFCFQNEADPEELEDSSDSSDSSDSDDSDDSIDAGDTTNSPVTSNPLFIAALKNNKITTLTDYRNFTLTRLLLTNGLCPGLVSLNIRRWDNDSNQDIFYILKDLPVLKQLTIGYFPFSIYLLETVHTNIPSLESLALLNIELLPSTCPASIVPATLVSRLKIKLSRECEENQAAEWLRYVSLKYSNLTYFYNDFDTCAAYTELMPLVVRNCGSSLTSLGFQSSIDQNLSVLSSIDTHFITELEIEFQDDALSYPVLEQTEHFIHLKKLALHSILPTRRLDRLKDIMGLESLNIEFVNPQSLDPSIEYKEKDYKLDIYALFKTFPASLQSISIKDVMLVFKYDDNYAEKYKRQFGQIKTFSLDMISLKQPKLDDFISQCLPNLTSLTMDEIYDFTHLFSIPNHRLSNLEISPYQCDFRFDDICLMTRNCPRYYNFGWEAQRNYSGLSDYGLPKRYSEIDLGKVMVVICASVERLELNGREVYLVSDRDKFKSL